MRPCPLEKVFGAYEAGTRIRRHPAKQLHEGQKLRLENQSAFSPDLRRGRFTQAGEALSIPCLALAGLS